MEHHIIFKRGSLAEGEQAIVGWKEDKQGLIDNHFACQGVDNAFDLCSWNDRAWMLMVVGRVTCLHGEQACMGMHAAEGRKRESCGFDSGRR